jgi:hypothetical protein
MGCVGPKSAIEVRDGMTFLDLTVRQIEVFLFFFFLILIVSQQRLECSRSLDFDEFIQY